MPKMQPVPKKILTTVGTVQVVFILFALFAYEPFYFEMNVLAGLLVLTPVIGIGVGLVLAFWLGRGNWKNGVLVWVVSILVAYPAFWVSMEAMGEPVRSLRLEWLQKWMLQGPERLLRELAQDRGWTLMEYDLSLREAYVVYEHNGKRSLASVLIDPKATVVGDISFLELERGFATGLGVNTVQLHPVHLLSRRFEARSVDDSAYFVTRNPGARRRAVAPGMSAKWVPAPSASLPAHAKELKQEADPG